MNKLTSLVVALFLFSLFICRQSYAVLERFNIGVGYGGTDELSISTDSPGEFNYNLYLRTANNTESWVNVHYTGVTNLARTIRLHCATNEPDAVDNPTTGTCISGGPFVRGAFVAGNDNHYAVVKLFTLFCGSIQIEKEQTTNNWNSDFNNNPIEEFLDNGASSTWCPANSPTATPTPKVSTTSSMTKKTTPTPTPTKKPVLTKKVPSPTSKFILQTIESETPTPTVVVGQTKKSVSEPENNNSLWVALGAGAALSALAIVGFLKRNSIKAFLSLLNKNKENTQEVVESINPVITPK